MVLLGRMQRVLGTLERKGSVCLMLSGGRLVWGWGGNTKSYGVINVTGVQSSIHGIIMKSRPRSRWVPVVEQNWVLVKSRKWP